MFCKYCGHEIADDSVFCEKCGKNIKEIAADKSEPVTSNVEASNSSANKEPSYEEPDTWYYLNGTEMDGPLSADSIRRKIENGRIDFEAKVRRSPSDPWVSLVDSPFADIAIKMTPAPVSVSDKWLWCLAIIPMAAMILLYYLKLMPTEGVVSWFIPFAINTTFFFLDKKELQDKGFYPEGWMWMGFFLIPVYLIVREAKTNRNFVPAIIWCFLFAVETFIL